LNPPTLDPPATRPWTKAIPEARDRRQSRLLVWIGFPALCYLTYSTVAIMHRMMGLHGHFVASSGRYENPLMATVPVSLVSALAAWRIGAVTPWGAVCGAVLCFLMIVFSRSNYGLSAVNSALTPLILLVVFTFEATRMRRQRSASSMGVTENLRPRNAGQIVANLGVAATFGSYWSWGITCWAGCPGGQFDPNRIFGVLYIPMLAALAEATADTVSSEIGQAFGGTPFLLTTMRRVPPGTDGAITPLGTLAGVTAAALVVASAYPAMAMPREHCVLAFSAGVAGLFFDSFLGATMERKGWIGNDLVNFISTAFAAAVSLVGIHYLLYWLLRSPANW
jgi:uncharacterized protein (TIGR00297 family)